jgi:hypothetical protein
LQCLNDKLGKRLMRLILAFILVPFLFSSSRALDLELITIIDGDTAAEDFGYNVQSPGDLDGDGFSEIFAGSKGKRLIKAYNGGNPPDIVPEMTMTDRVEYAFKWIDDINGDSYKDFATYKWTYGDQKAYEIYFGGPDFYSKTEPDLVFIADYQEGFRNVFCEDFDGDGDNELMIQGEHPEWPIQSKYYIYETGPDMDTIADYIFKIMHDGIAATYLSKCIGDLNDDGYAEFITISGINSKPGYIQIYFGNAEHDSIPDIQIWSPWDYVPGEGTFGWDIIEAGDLNRDGFNDFIITSSGYPPCIFYGGNPIDTIPKILEYPGRNANICGDINHDGWEDIAVGEPWWADESGIVYVYFGAYDMDTIADIILISNDMPTLPWSFGKSVGCAGDFNGDGVDDLAVGADEIDIDNWNVGQVFIFAGDPNLPTPAEDEPDVPIPIDYDILKQNYPNPFNNSTVIEYLLYGISEREIELGIYNILGQKIRTLYSGLHSGGEHVMFWDGLDDRGHDVPSGIYFYQLKSGTEVISKKMVYLK